MPCACGQDMGIIASFVCVNVTVGLVGTSRGPRVAASRETATRDSTLGSGPETAWIGRG